MFHKNTIVDLFSEQVRKTPNNVAVIFENSQLTYRELDEKSNKLARYLNKNGVKEETLVPICINRSLEMIVAIWGILKAGAAYVPIDPEYPAERIEFILRDIKSSIILSRSNCIFSLREIPDVSILFLDQESFERESSAQLERKPEPGNLAYVIYTSGSTGKPKGVMIEHHSLISYLFSKENQYIIPDQRNNSGNYFHLSYTFDGSIPPLFLPLLFGKSVVIRTSADEAPFEDPFFFANAPYDFIVLTPAHMPLLQSSLKGTRLDTITKKLIFGGEVLHYNHIKFLVESKNNIEVNNVYGPTEATVGCSAYIFNTAEIDETTFNNISIPIGKPISGITLYVLDKEGAPVQNGGTGELHISGDQLARGYLNQPELTSEKFISNNFSDNIDEKMYKTGDLVKYLPDGNIEYVGRQDDQVKIRGYRIELGEIEKILQQCAGIKQCVVLAKPDNVGNKRLIAYVVPAKDFDKTKVINFMEGKLPEFMVPRLMIELEFFPLTTNGKINKGALPDATDASILLTNTYIAPKNRTETIVTDIWKELLGISRVGTADNFFELGGNSLLTQKMVFLLKKEFNVPITFRQLNEQFNTIQSLAAYIDGMLTHKDGQTDKKQSNEPTLESISKQLEQLTKQVALLQESLYKNKIQQVPSGNVPTSTDGSLIPPIVGAKLGKDKIGNPAWFITDEKNPGKYLQVYTKEDI